MNNIRLYPKELFTFVKVGQMVSMTKPDGAVWHGEMIQKYVYDGERGNVSYSLILRLLEEDAIHELASYIAPAWPDQVRLSVSGKQKHDWWCLGPRKKFKFDVQLGSY